LGRLDNLQPKKVFEYFESLCNIPHGSYNCKAVSDYCVQFAKDRGLEWIQDDAYNVIIKKSASSNYKGDSTLILQGHLDMVCQKTTESTIDFEKDPLDLHIDGDFLFAKGTSLGGDDGIAVAYALAVLDDDTLKHPNLEVVFTTEEEVGMLGASALDISSLKAKYLLNIDSEEEGILIASCAGGNVTKAVIPVQYQSENGDLYELTIQGLLGGHSGTEIDKNHANSHKLLGEVLSVLNQKNGKIVSLGGNEDQKDNAIPSYSYVSFLADDVAVFKEEASHLKEMWEAAYDESEDGICVSIESKAQDINTKVLTKESAECLERFLKNSINGVQTMSADMEGLVESSLNLGIIHINDTEFTATFGVRSSVASLMDTMFEIEQKVTESCGGTLERLSEYPEWEYRKDSLLREQFVKAYKELFGQDMKVEAIHAGLECSILGAKIPDLDMVAFGPDIFDIHTVKERLSISSTKRVWELLLKIIEEFP
jgi:dipeptidase D